jgi:uncharacterized protein YraI
MPEAHLRRFVMLKAVLVAIAFLTAGSAAQAACIVTDPTGTPLNIRSSPNGGIVGTLRNGTSVTIQTVAYDGQGRPWAYIGVGWVFREFVTCY